MQPEMFFLAERLVMAVEGIAGNVNNISISLTDISANISYLVTEKRCRENPDLSFSSNINENVTEGTTDPLPGTSLDEQLTYILSDNCCVSGDGYEHLVDGDEPGPEDERSLPVEETSLNGHENTWETLVGEDPLAPSPKRELIEEGSEILDNDLEDGTVSESGQMLVPKREPIFEPEEEMNDAEGVKECVGETSNVQSASNVMNISCDMINPDGLLNDGRPYTKSTLTASNELLSEGVGSPEMLCRRKKAVMKINEEIYNIASRSTIEMPETQNQKRSAVDESRKEVMGTGSESDCRGIIEDERRAQGAEESHSRERSRSSFLKEYSELSRNTRMMNSFCCEICGKYCYSNSGLENHLRVHTGEKPFKCAECKKSFANKCNLVAHMHIHTGKMPFKCSFCGKAFYKSSHLSSHELVHTGEKRFECGACKKAFSLKCNLVRHMRYHTGEKPFKCSRCDKAFVQSTDLTNHMRYHTGERPFTCKVCGKRYKQSSHLSYHTHHVHAAVLTTFQEEALFQCNVTGTTQ